MLTKLTLVATLLGAACANRMLSVSQTVEPFSLSEWAPNEHPLGLPYTGLWVWGHLHTTDGSDLDFNVLVANRLVGYTSMAWEDYGVCNNSRWLRPYNGPMTIIEGPDFMRNISRDDNGTTYSFTIHSDGKIEYKDTSIGVDVVSHAAGCRFEWRPVFEDPVDNIVYRSRLGDVSGTVNGHPVEGIFGTDGYWGVKPWANTPAFVDYEREWVVFYDKLRNGKIRYGTTVWGPAPLRAGYMHIAHPGDNTKCGHADLLTEDVLIYNEADCAPKPESLFMMSSRPLGIRSYITTQFVVSLPLRPDIGITLHEANAVHFAPRGNAIVDKSFAWWEHVEVRPPQ